MLKFNLWCDKDLSLTFTQNILQDEKVGSVSKVIYTRDRHLLELIQFIIVPQPSNWDLAMHFLNQQKCGLSIFRLIHPDLINHNLDCVLT